ncbi:MAG: hypothetical protein ACRD15_23305, partial [Vicinamibacterales bacterium]
VEKLPDPARAWVEKIFRALTTMEGPRAVRRSARLDRLFEVLGVTGDEGARAEVKAAISAFIQPENSLLVSSTGLELRDDSVIDISHESLIRNWHNLRRWLMEETRSAEWFRSLVDDTIRFRTGEAGPWRDPELARVLQLRQESGWNEAWAYQYRPKADPPYAEVVRFLDESVRTQQQERTHKEAQRRKEIEDATTLARAAARAKKFYRLFAWTLLLLLVAIFAGLTILWRQHEAERAQAQQSLVAAAQIDQITAEQEKLRDDLRAAQARLEEAKAGGSSAESLQRQVNDLQNRLSSNAVAADNKRQELKQSSAAAGSEYSGAIKQVTDLQTQLREARAERDRLQGQIDNYGTVQGRDAAYWRSQFEAATTENKQLKSAGGTEATEPIILALPQYSALRVREAPFSGNAFLFVSDLARNKSTRSTLWLILPSSGAAFTEFVENESAARKVAANLRSRVSSCPGYQTNNQASVWCFTVDKEKAIGHTQPLGRFRFGAANYAVVATGWAQNARPGGTDVLSLVIYPLRPAAASAK